MKKVILITLGMIVAIIGVTLSPGTDAQYSDSETVHVKVMQPVSLEVDPGIEFWSDETGYLVARVTNFKPDPVSIGWYESGFEGCNIVAVMPGGYEHTIPGNTTQVFTWELHPNGSPDWEGDWNVGIYTKE